MSPNLEMPQGKCTWTDMARNKGNRDSDFVRYAVNAVGLNGCHNGLLLNATDNLCYGQG